ncbi:hypothetical protein GLAREA_07624 [Glarea lozoyensis ATCC 20868]|uniref:Auxin efflux carrier n=1 Tax=Glarea lozoyensis (strain ATCC 20868 / MF5171) TaxID=1116229 RepID=S3D3W0_GLAL2|nr:uncharacterized protein GLAREA_07624 [Glarea lozoyensis ATCC 20868]EPE32490.1 hypothetical protein GLAREA_07624 [Glarea lozoyensis ATCC 20868]
MSSSVLQCFLGALQASLSVLLTMSYGVVASRFRLLRESSSRDINQLCVGVFLPALLITNVGTELSSDSVGGVIPVLAWAIVYTLSSMTVGYFLRRAFKFPAWTTPAICFNNTTALPLLLTKSLQTSGILESLTTGVDDTSSDAVTRATSYFLFASIVSNTFTFAVGPKLLDDEESPEDNDDDNRNVEQEIDDQTEDCDNEHTDPRNWMGRTAEEEEDVETERTTLLPDEIAHHSHNLINGISQRCHKHYSRLPFWLQNGLSVIKSFLTAPLIGAAIGAVLGLTPILKRAFFDSPSHGGIFKAWLTSSLEDVGDLFAALELVAVGAKLSTCLVKMKQGESSGQMRPSFALTIFFIRFIMWPIVSIGTVYTIASNTRWLGHDPMLWFVLMLLPTGPPATKLTALADVSGTEEEEKMAIAKFIAMSYAISPVICLAVVGSLKASTALKSQLMV